MANQTDPTGEGGSSTSTSDGGEFSVRGNVIEMSLPSWLEILRPFAAAVQQYGSWPRAIVAVIVTFIVGTFLQAGAIVIGGVQTAFRWIQTIPVIIATNIVDLGEPVSGAATGLVADFTAFLSDLAASGGPAAPIIIVLAIVAVLVIVGRAVIVLLASLPVIGAVFDYFGVDP